MSSAFPAPDRELKFPPALARRFEAVVFDWDGTAGPDGHASVSGLRRLIEEACGTGLDLAVVSDTPVRDLDGQLAARPRGPGGLVLASDHGGEAFVVGPDGPELAYRRATGAPGAGMRVAEENADVGSLEVGLADGPGSRDWVMGWLWRRGIAPEQVLIAGQELRLTGLDAVVAVLQDQLARRRHGELPIGLRNAEWCLTVTGVDPLLERVHESLLTIADGRLGTRGGVLTGHPGEQVGVLMSGVYTRTGAETHLLAAPRWNTISLDDPHPRSIRRVLDLHAGVLRQELRGGAGQTDAMLLSSLVRPGTAVLRVSDGSTSLEDSPPLVPPFGPKCAEGQTDGCHWMRVSGRPGSIVAAARDHLRGTAGDRVLDRAATYEGVTKGSADEGRALARLRDAERVGFDGLLAEHRRAWASRWDEADIAIDGDPELALAVRFAIFHLLASAPDDGEAAVGARGLSGSAYRGHVFWDTDVFVLPMLAATHPQAARAMLEYRIRRLPAAIQAAKAHGGQGARFPWESAWSGEDVTPEHGRGRGGELVPILTGQLEEHIVADVAWAAACYIDWTGDQVFAAGSGRELIVETARWWASRIEVDTGGRGHIRSVIGPDEYHENVDDNAYTNVMARWHLRRAATAGGDAVDVHERQRWLELAESIVDGYDPATGIYEQFDGFNGLEPLLIAGLSPRIPVAADMLLGHARTQGSQVLKQADVLMLHYLVPDEVADGSLQPNLDFYGPRTSHGSTLSPGVHATLLARAGRVAEALEMLRLTARIDLDDIGQMAAGGLHLAAMGSVWRALTYGFAGLKPAGDALAIEPVLPPGWDSLEVRVRFRGSRVRVRVLPHAVEASADPAVPAILPGGERVRLGRVAQTFSRGHAFAKGDS